MNEEQRERFFDLLTMKAICGLNEAEERELQELDPETAEAEFRSLEQTAAAISMIGIESDEKMPSHIFNRIVDAAQENIRVSEDVKATPLPPPESAKAEEADRGTPWFSWLGWAVAAAACIALAVNIFVPRNEAPSVAVNRPQVEIPRVLTPAEMREEMLRTNAGMIRATWAPGNVKELAQVSGDVVWSDEKQAGYMRFRGLPVNETSEETYQLWIFDETQDKATPIDGGTFDISSDGEVVIPINAKLKARSPEMFAITIEKPGGVVVSKREKLAALAKIETPVSQGT